MAYQIHYEVSPKLEDVQVLNDGLYEQAKNKKGMKPFESFAYFIRDKNNQNNLPKIVTVFLYQSTHLIGGR